MSLEWRRWIDVKARRRRVVLLQVVRIDDAFLAAQIDRSVGIGIESLTRAIPRAFVGWLPRRGFTVSRCINQLIVRARMQIRWRECS